VGVVGGRKEDWGVHFLRNKGDDDREIDLI
jgi:hypothetical protein